MTRRHLLALSALLAFSIVVIAAPPAISEAGRAALSDFLRTSVGSGGVPAVVALVANADRVIYEDAAGRRNVAGDAAATPDTIFRIASMTKPVTSLAVMMLVEEGKIGVDEPVTKYLSDFKQQPVLEEMRPDGTFGSHPAARPILIRHLLTNTSGIGYPFSNDSLAKLSAAGKAEADLPLVHEPGSKWTYGSSTAVLGRVVERVSGQTLDVFFQNRIFGPLEMRDTFYVVPADKRDRVVTQHARGANGALVETPNPAEIRSGIRGDGGLASTARDYAAFMQLFLNGGRHGATRLVGERTLRLMTANQIGSLVVPQQPSADPVRARPFPIGAGKDKFGFGFQIETVPAEKGLRRAGSLSWGGIYNTHFWIDPERQIAAVVLMQVLPYYDDAALRVLRGFERLVYQQVH
jgi:CubicO group peptidase (beta-lactamase class C family)